MGVLNNDAELAARFHDDALGELANGRPAAALTALRRALALAPGRVAAHHALGVALEELERLDEAGAAYGEALRLDWKYAAARQSLGELLRRRGRLAQARDCFETALLMDPALNNVRIALARTLVDMGQVDAAVSCYREAIVRSPETAALHIELGTALWKTGDSRGALQAFERAVVVAPGSAEAHYNLGSAMLELGRFDAAFASAGEAQRLRPGFADALLLNAAGLAANGALDAGVALLERSVGTEGYLLLAIRLMNSRLFDPARRCLVKALQEAPADTMARHLLAALSGENPDHPAAGYVRQLFDASAASFDQNLVSKLGYEIPREMVQELGATGNPAQAPWDVLDLGCGTGLVGAEIVSHSRRLVGIDLAPNMIERARARNVYTELRCADLLDALAEEQGHYDVVTAADVFIYVGKLDEVMPAVRRVLHPGGLFAFSAEAAEASDGRAPQGYRLGVMGRYAHSAAYLRRLAEQNRFRVELLRETRIRFEHRQPVRGWLTIWRAGPPADCRS